MNVSKLVSAMALAGCTVDQVASVVAAFEQEAADKRREAADRKAAYRATRNLSPGHCETSGDIARHAETNEDSTGPIPPPKEKSPTPSKEITPTQTSLRSDISRAKAIFENEFWPAYPRRRGTNSKDLAEKKFVLLVQQGIDPSDIVAGVRGYARSRAGEDPQFTKQAVVWLNAGLWKDDYSPMPEQRAGPHSRETMGSVMMDILGAANGRGENELFDDIQIHGVPARIGG